MMNFNSLKIHQILLILFASVICNVKASDTDFVPSACNKGSHWSPSGCVVCEYGYFQPNDYVKVKNCSPWTYKNSTTNRHWSLVQDGTDVSDHEWECEEGYHIRNINSLEICEKDESITTIQPGITINVNRFFNTSVPTSSVIVITQTDPDDKSGKSLSSEMLILAILISTIVVALFIICIIKRKSFGNKIISMFNKGDDKDSGNGTVKDPEIQSLVAQELLPVESKTSFIPTESSFKKEVLQYDSLNLDNNDISENPQISRSYFAALATKLEGKLHMFINVLESPNEGFDCEKELKRLKRDLLFRKEDNVFYESGFKVLMQWGRHNEDCDQKTSIKKALSSINESHVLESLEEEEEEEGKYEENSSLLNKLFYFLIDNLDNGNIEALIRQLPCRESYDSSVALNEAKRNNQTNVQSSYFDTLKDWRKRNKHIPLKLSLEKTLLSLEEKAIIENEKYINLIDGLCPDENSGDATHSPNNNLNLEHIDQNKINNMNKIMPTDIATAPPLSLPTGTNEYNCENQSLDAAARPHEGDHGEERQYTMPTIHSEDLISRGPLSMSTRSNGSTRSRDDIDAGKSVHMGYPEVGTSRDFKSNRDDSLDQTEVKSVFSDEEETQVKTLLSHDPSEETEVKIPYADEM